MHSCRCYLSNSLQHDIAAGLCLYIDTLQELHRILQHAHVHPACTQATTIQYRTCCREDKVICT